MVGLNHRITPWRAVISLHLQGIDEMTFHNVNELLLSFQRGLVYLKCKLTSIVSSLCQALGCASFCEGKTAFCFPGEEDLGSQTSRAEAPYCPLQVRDTLAGTSVGSRGRTG